LPDAPTDPARKAGKLPYLRDDTRAGGGNGRYRSKPGTIRKVSKNTYSLFSAIAHGVSVTGSKAKQVIQSCYQYNEEYVCCCLIDENECMLLPMLKVNVEGVLMDFDEKHKINQYEWIFSEPPLSVRHKLEKICKKIHRVLQFNTYCRFDFIINDKGIYLLEVNNLPGIDGNSLFNRALKAAKLDIINLILMAYKNGNIRQKNNYLLVEQN
jgi:hypothetical protein